MSQALRWALLLTFVCALAAPSLGAAQRRPRQPDPPPGVSVALTPAPASLSSFHYIFTLRTTSWPSAEVVADRRLLSFVVHPEGGRRTHTCRHPDAPRRVPEGRIQTLGGRDAEHREWIDLRMYCWGRALTALEGGARVEVRYGFGRRGPGLWVARRPDPDTSAGRESARVLEGAEIAFAPPSTPTAEGAEPEDAPLITVTMPSRDVRSGASLVFSPRLRATAGSHHVYVRDDLFRYRIRGPLGEHECALERTPIAPIIDFYRTVSPRRSASGTLAIRLACPDAFQVAGIYEVTPIVDLVYDAADWDIDDVATGTFEGRPVPIRVRTGEHGYVEQVPGTEASAATRGDS
jgi:hypothetical protein